METQKTAYTIDESRQILNHFICGNGKTLGKIYFRAHLKEGDPLLSAFIREWLERLASVE